MIYKILSMIILGAALTAVPAEAQTQPSITATFGSPSGLFGRVRMFVNNLPPGQVVRVRTEYVTDVTYLDGRPNPGPYTSATLYSFVQLPSDGTFTVGSFGHTGNGSWREDLREIRVYAETSGGYAIRFTVRPPEGQLYLPFNPVRPMETF